MNKLEFDFRGNLKPYDKIELDYEEFVTIFFNGFQESLTRQKIHEQYIQYLKAFQEEITKDFVQWVDGSFISNKLNPKDIDFVTLIDYDVYKAKEKLIESKFRKFGFNNNFKMIDAYAIKYYPIDHQKHKITDYDLVYWRNWFGETKKNRARKKFPKGFIELKFGNKKSNKI